jgi:cyclopropane-fatty-acyl-phospholipid synthase
MWGPYNPKGDFAMTETIVPSQTSYLNRDRTGLMGRAARRLVLNRLGKLVHGEIHLTDGKDRFRFGRKTTALPLSASITVHHPAFYHHILTGGDVGAGEAYMTGHWSTDDLTAVVRIILRNQMVLADINSTWSRLTAPVNQLYHFLRRNSRRGSRSNIVAHYDLGNDFYRLFLDDTLTYSCGIFETPQSTLKAASIAKYDRICRKLDLSPDDHVLEIGTGWGGFAIHAAQNYGCRITTTTISDEQYKEARRRISAAGLSDRVTVIKRDYRDLEGQYDKLVSIEMIEAVGHQYYRRFFETCGKLLKPDGLMAIQAITMGDHLFDRHKHSVDFIKRYIFPGSCIPSITALHKALAKSSDLRLFHMEDITPHYAVTLRHWRERFFDRIEEVRSQGFPEAFIRMWDFYLSYCEAGFAERYIGDVQMVFSKPLTRRDPILADLG